MLPLSQKTRKNQIAYHSYADNTQIYLALSPNDYSPIDSLCQCIDEINSWMCQNFLQLNKEKTEVIAFGNKDEVLKVNAYLDSRGQTTKNQVRNLGVILETDLSFSSHVKAVTKSAYYHLKNIARIRCFVSNHDLEKLVHAFITSRVDYCNGLLTGLPKKTIRQLQLIQNAAARILTRTRKSEHITPVLKSLHWLPVTFRIDFKGVVDCFFSRLDCVYGVQSSMCSCLVFLKTHYFHIIYLYSTPLCPVAPECTLDDGAGRHIKVGRHVSLRPPPISLVYDTAELIGVDVCA